jgi:hypothetical protein
MRFCILVSALCLLTSVAFALPEPGFDPKDVVRQVGAARSGPSAVSREPSALDDGEFLIDTSITYIPASDDQKGSAVAFDGTNFLVVWTDYRNNPDTCDIYGARVTPAGVVLDPSGIAISTAAYDQYVPAVAFDDTNFLVVWTDGRSGSPDIYGSRVTPAGVVLDPSGIAISTAAYCQRRPAVAFDGANCLVVWEDDRSADTSHIYGARVSQAGTVLDPTGIAISTAAYGQSFPAVAFDGTNFLVVWQDWRSGVDSDIYGARVTQAGVVRETSGIGISRAADYQLYPAVAFDGTNFLVVWQDTRSGVDNDIYGARVTQAGVVLDSAGIAISTAAGYKESPVVAFDGTNFLVVWTNGGDIYGARVTQAGLVLDPSGIAISTAAYGRYSPAVAFDRTNSLVVWEDSRSGVDYDIYGARVTPAGVVLDSAGIAISTAAGYQESPVVAFDGANFLVVWQDFRSADTSDIYGARVTQAGVVLDPSGIAISTAAYSQFFPAVGFDGANFLVVWQDTRNGGGYLSDIYGARVTPAGVVLDPAGIPISTAVSSQGTPALAFDGTNYLVVWTVDDIYGARVTPAGVVLDPSGIAISTAANNQLDPAVAYDGTDFLVVWEDYRSGVDWDIYGARVTQAGVVLDPSGIAVSTAADSQYVPAVAFDGTNFLVVWQDRRSGLDFDIYGARVTPAGVVLDPSGIAIAMAATDQLYPAVSFDGTDYLVVWTDERSGAEPDICGARVRPDGTVFDEGRVMMQEGDQSYPTLARGAGSQMFLVYQGWAGTVGSKTYNTDRIWGKMNPSPAVAEMTKPEVRMTNSGATVVRGVLFLPDDRGPGTGDRVALLDIGGRKVLGLRPGANDVRALPPGVYFVREAHQAARRIVITR